MLQIIAGHKPFMACVPGQSSGPRSRAQDPVCGTLTTVVRSRVNSLCIWLALVASVSKGMRRVWARFPSAHAELIGTNGFTVYARGLVADTTGPEGEKAIQYQSVALFTKGWYYSAGEKYGKLLACMRIVDKHRQCCQTAISRHVFRLRFTSKWM